MRSTPHPPRFRLVAFAATAAVLLAACGDQSDEALPTAPAASDEDAADDPGDSGAFTAELADSWIAVAGTIDGDPVALLADGPITIEIGDGASVRGQAACNSYDGDARFGSGGALSFGQLAITEMGCMDDGVMQLERLYIDTLAALDTWALDGEMLVLSGPTAEWRFERVEPEPEPSVDPFGTTWVLETHIDGEAASNAAVFELVVLRLAEDRTFEGTSGCGAIVDGRWDGRGERAVIVSYDIVVDPAAGACSDAVYDIERIVISVLDRMPEIVIDGDRLTLETGEGESLVFRAVPDADPTDDEAASDEPPAPVGLSAVSVRPVLGCGEESLTADADIVQVDPAQQLDCALGPPISDGSVFAANAEATPGATGQWTVAVSIASEAREAWDAAATECFERGAECPTGQLAIVANGAIVSAPLVQTPTFPGEIVISGAFTESDARSIAASINVNG